MLLVPQTGWAVSFTIDNLKYVSISSDEVKIEQSPSAGGGYCYSKRCYL